MTDNIMIVYEAYHSNASQLNNDCACDCDCSPTRFVEATSQAFRPSLGVHRKYRLHPDLIFIDLQDGYHVVANPSSQMGIVLLDASAFDFLIQFKEPRPVPPTNPHTLEKLAWLLKYGFLIDALSPIPFPSFETESALIAWLHITNACPLVCKYCYIRKTSSLMSLETGKRAIDLVFDEALKHEFCGIKLKYAGGEPSLNLELVKTLHRHSLEKARIHELNLDEVLLTSGVMSDKSRQEIINLGLRVMISIDALGSEHNAQRPLINGKGTSEPALRTLNLFVQHGVDICVSITVTNQSAEALIELIELLLTADVPFSINYARDNDHFQEPDAFLPKNDHLIETMQRVVHHLSKNPPRRSLLSSLIDRANLAGPHQYTCGVGRNYLVIDHEGRISMCQQEMDTPITSIYEADPLLRVINNEIGIKNLPVHKKQGCRTCEWRYWCTGGCAALTVRAHGRADIRSPFCDVYKSLFPEIVRLEGLRLLKYHHEMLQSNEVSDLMEIVTKDSLNQKRSSMT